MFPSFKTFLRSTRTAVIAAAVLAGPLAAAPTALAGRLEGPGVSHNVADGNSTVTYYDTFEAGEIAVIRVDGDGDTDLDLFVYDESGNLITSDTDAGDICVVRFVPRWTGRFRIVVRNLGGVYNRFTLRTN